MSWSTIVCVLRLTPPVTSDGGVVGSVVFHVNLLPISSLRCAIRLQQWDFRTIVVVMYCCTTKWWRSRTRVFRSASLHAFFNHALFVEGPSLVFSLYVHRTELCSFKKMCQIQRETIPKGKAVYIIYEWRLSYLKFRHTTISVIATIYTTFKPKAKTDSRVWQWHAIGLKPVSK